MTKELRIVKPDEISFVNQRIVEKSNPLTVVRQTLQAPTLRYISRDPKNKAEIARSIFALIERHVDALVGVRQGLLLEDKKKIGAEIFNQHKSLTLTEIAYALHAETVKPVDDQVKHYGRPTVGYFMQILKNYRDDRAQIMTAHNLTKLEQPEASDKLAKGLALNEREIESMLKNGVRAAWDYFVENRGVETGRLWIFEHLQELDVKTWTDDEITAVYPIAKARLNHDRKDLLKRMTEQQGAEQIQRTAKRILLERYYAELHEAGKTLYGVVYGS